MLDIKFLRDNPEIVKDNLRKKFQDHKLPLVDEVIELDKKNREIKQNGDELKELKEIKKISEPFMTEILNELKQNIIDFNFSITKTKKENIYCE